MNDVEIVNLQQDENETRTRINLVKIKLSGLLETLNLLENERFIQLGILAGIYPATSPALCKVNVQEIAEKMKYLEENLVQIYNELKK